MALVRARRLTAVVLVGAVAVSLLHAAELEERTRLAYQRYAADARTSFIARVSSNDFPGFTGDRNLAGRLRSGAIVGGPGQGDGINDLPGGLVHHWVGTAFVPNATVQEAVALSQTFSEYPAIYASVVSSRLVEREGNIFRVRFRLREDAGVVTAVLDVTSRIEYVRPADRRAYSVSEAVEIREIEDAGRPAERLLPPGQDRGYLWGAHTFTSYVEGDGGVYIELVTLGLSRDFQPLLGWIIEPIARRLGRKSVEGSLEEFGKALRRRIGASGASPSGPDEAR